MRKKLLAAAALFSVITVGSAHAVCCDGQGAHVQQHTKGAGAHVPLRTKGAGAYSSEITGSIANTGRLTGITDTLNNPKGAGTALTEPETKGSYVRPTASGSNPKGSGTAM